MEVASLLENQKRRVFWITRRLALGAFATESRAEYLLAQGVTHIFNVGEGASIVRAQPSGFRQVIDYPIVDLERIPDSAALACLDLLHGMLNDSSSKVYIHCIAGQNRSPTLLWLYLIACGVALPEARELIERRTLDAVPGHVSLIDAALIQLVRTHGEGHFCLCTTRRFSRPPTEFLGSAGEGTYCSQLNPLDLPSGRSNN